MKDNNLEIIDNSVFENIKHIDKEGNEYWEARELMIALKYTKWENFKKVIDKAIITCRSSNYIVSDHFPDVRKMVQIGSGAEKEIVDYELSRYACYLIAQNADNRKKVVALAQTYFAIQTRKMELLERDYNSLTEDEKRLYQRSLTKKGNYSLNQTARKVGVKNFDKFHNAGYRGLYNGETANDIAKRKGLRYREDILDNMGSEELADNLFRIVQTDAKLKKDNIIDEGNANGVHCEVGKAVRDTIKKLDGTMPEDLPTPGRSLKEIEKDGNIKKIMM